MTYRTCDLRLYLTTVIPRSRESKIF